MFRKTLATLAAASIALTSMTAAPAQAGEKEFIKFLTGATALVIIGSAIANSNNQPATRQQVHIEPERVHKPRPPRQVHVTPTPPRQTPHRPQYSARMKLPAACVHNFRTYDGTFRMFSARCLHRTYGLPRTLPHACKQQMHTVNRGPNWAYRMPCLRRSGYRIASY